MRIRKFIPPMSIVLFLLLTVPGASQAADMSSIVEFKGVVLDAETGKPIEQHYSFEEGRDFDQYPGEINWGYAAGTTLRDTGGKFTHKIGLPKGARLLLRIQAKGYVSQLVMPEPVTAPATVKGLVIRLSHGLTLHGRVLDHDGRPVEGAWLFLRGDQDIYLLESPRVLPPRPDTTSDKDGRFALRGLAKGMNVVVVSTPLLCVWRGEVTENGDDITINLPEPATLILRYDIQGDDVDGQFNLYRVSWKEPATKGLSDVGYVRTVPNGGESVLKLAPGLYHLYRMTPYGGFPLDRRQIRLEAGKTLAVDFIRKTGDPITGTIAGLDGTGATKATIWVKAPEAKGDPYDFDPPSVATFDGAICAVGAEFKTARIPPGKYKLVAEAYKPEAFTDVAYTGIRLPDYIGAAEVTVPEEGPPAPVRIEMKPRPERPRAAEGAPAVPVSPGEKEAPKRITYAGVVTDADGKPVAGAVVRSEVLLQQPDGSFKKNPGEAETRTDAAGQFSLGPLEAPGKDLFRRLVFDHPVYPLLPLRDSSSARLDNPSHLAVVLLRPTEVSGVVTDDDGHPVADAAVDAIIHQSREKAASATTDANGRFTLARIPEGSLLTVAVTHKQFVVYPPRGARFQRPRFYDSVPAGRKDLQIKLQPAARIAGRLLLDGKPLEKAGIAVYARSNDTWRAVTDKDGHFELNSLPPDTYRLSAFFVTRPLKEIIMSGSVEVPLAANPEPRPLDLTLERKPLYEVSGEVADAKTGRPVAGSFTGVTSPSFQSEGAWTDAEGRFVLYAPAGESTVSASPPREMLETYKYASQKVVIKPDGTANRFDLALVPYETVTVRGQLVDENGKGVAGVVTGLMRNRIETAPDGTFEARLPAEKSYLPWRSAEAFNLDKRLGATFAMDPNQAGEIRKIVLQPTVTIKGRVVYEDGVPAPNARLRLLRRSPDPGWSEYRSCDPNADGTFTFGGVAFGLPMILSPQARGMSGHFDLKDAKPGETIDAGDIKLKGIVRGITRDTLWEGVISGRVLDENRKPIRGAFVESAVQTSGTTDAEGRFRLDGLPEVEELRVWIEREGYVREEIRLKPGARDVEVQLIPPGYATFGKPAPELSVAKWFNSEPLELSKLRGKVVLLYLGLNADYNDYFLDRDATLLADLQKKYADKGLVVIIVHRDLNYSPKAPMTEDRVAAFLKKRKIAVPFAIDRPDPTPPAEGRAYREFEGATFAAYQLKSTPSMILIDRAGVVRRSPTYSNVNEWVEKLLAEPLSNPARATPP